MEPLEVIMFVEIKSPPLSRWARIEVGWLLGRIQLGELLSMPLSRPMPSIGRRVHELRVGDVSASWRVIYRIDPDFLLVVDLFSKKTPSTPAHVLTRCKNRLQNYDTGG